METKDILEIEELLNVDLRTETKIKYGEPIWKANKFLGLAIFRCRKCKDYFGYEIKSLPPQKIYCEKCKPSNNKKYDRTAYHKAFRSKLLEFLDFNCVVCDQSFKPKRNTAKTCSSKCRKKLSRNKEKYQDKIAHPIWGDFDEIKLDDFWKGHIQDIKTIGLYDEMPQKLLDRREEIEKMFIERDWVRRYKPSYFSVSKLLFK